MTFTLGVVIALLGNSIIYGWGSQSSRNSIVADRFGGFVAGVGCSIGVLAIFGVLK